MIVRYATCNTTGCASSGSAIQVTSSDEGVAVICGVCDNPIVDVTDTPPEPVMEMPTWA